MRAHKNPSEWRILLKFMDQNKNHFNFLQLNLFEKWTDRKRCMQPATFNLHAFWRVSVSRCFHCDFLFSLFPNFPLVVWIRSAHLLALLHWKKWWCVNLLTFFIRTNEPLTRRTNGKNALNTERGSRYYVYCILHTVYPLGACDTLWAEYQKKKKRGRIFFATKKCDGE